MSEESRRQDKERALRRDELSLLHKLLATLPKDYERELDVARVMDMSDGGMGSIRFISPAQKAKKFRETIIEFDYTDTDGVAVNIAVNIDEDHNLYEIDFWKVDFSPLLTYPNPEQVRLK